MDTVRGEGFDYRLCSGPEPLLHFLVLGATLFGLYALARPPDRALLPTHSAVSAGRIEQVAHHTLRPATCLAHGLRSWAFAAVITWSGSNPNFFWSSLSGADAPNVRMPMMCPTVPT